MNLPLLKVTAGKGARFIEVVVRIYGTAWPCIRKIVILKH
jgi:hypothetical protein